MCPKENDCPLFSMPKNGIPGVSEDTDPGLLNKGESMNTKKITALTEAEMISTSGGWDWDDFFGAVAWTTAVACRFTGHVGVCIVSAVSAGIAFFFFVD